MPRGCFWPEAHTGSLRQRIHRNASCPLAEPRPPSWLWRPTSWKSARVQQLGQKEEEAWRTRLLRYEGWEIQWDLWLTIGQLLTTKTKRSRLQGLGVSWRHSWVRLTGPDSGGINCRPCFSPRMGVFSWLFQSHFMFTLGSA